MDEQIVTQVKAEVKLIVAKSDRCAYPGCQNAAQPGRPLCAGCEKWENAAWRDHADELRHYAAVSAGVG